MNIDVKNLEKEIKTNTETENKKESAMKFFYLWFGIPIVLVVILGWIMGHC